MTTVNTNLNAQVAQHALTANQRQLSEAMAQLSTGKRLNSAADDAAGVSMASIMATQVRSLNQAVRNSNDGISMLQTADGAAGGLQNVLYRMKELSVQAGNDTNSSDERTALNNEFTQLKQQLTNMVNNTTWNGMKVLDGTAGSAGTVSIHVGPAANDNVAVNFANLATTVAAFASHDLLSASKAGLSNSAVDTAIDQISSARATWGAVINRLTHAADNAINVSQRTSASYSQVMDADYAQATADLAKALILDQAGSAMLSQANQQPYYVLALLS